MAGRPRGAWANKAWRDALRLAVLREVDWDEKPKTKLDELADSLITAAKGGDISALKELGDRLDGKPAQAIVGGDDDDPAVRVITEIRRSIVDPRHTDG
ncbi:MAG: hypothetical protein K0R61_9 [Microvirga sp.]|nr:hypothetical protein [Microvirga sp.]MDF2969559.1 hypothetical protein [Microvirga sp.]